MALDIAKIRNVGVRRPRRRGQDVPGRSHPVRLRRHTRLGKVDDGTTTTDFDPDEIKRKISLNTAVAFCDYKGHRLNLVDTPGYGDFVADARAGLRVAEAAVVVVDAVAGVQVQTEKVWKFANEYDLPRADRGQPARPRARRLLPHARVAARSGSRAASCPLQVPIGEETGFRGVVDLVAHEGARRPRRRQGRRRPTSRPSSRSASKAGARSSWRRRRRPTTTCSPSIWRRAPSAEEEMLGAPRPAIVAGGVVPVLCARRPRRASASRRCSTSS